MKFIASILTLAALAGAGNLFATEAAGTLAEHLATNAVARITNPPDLLPFRGPNSLGLDRLTGAVWSRTCWLHDVQGLSATPIGFTNYPGGQGLMTMVSPRHFLCATHMHPEAFTVAFLDTNNLVHYRHSIQRLDVGSDTSVGILNEDLPPAVGYLPVLPAEFWHYLPATTTNYVQGIGMNQDFSVFSQPMIFGNPGFVIWNPEATAPGGLPKNWSIPIRGGDSSNPALLLISNQLVLVSHCYTARSGPNYAYQLFTINEKMHQLSTNNHAASDYQLTEICLTNWPVIR